MKLLRVIASVDPATGGPIAGLRAITPALKSLGHDTEFLTVDPPSGKFLTDLEFSVHACGPVRGSYARSQHLRQWLNQHGRDFDAIIVHGLWQDLGRAVNEFCERTPIPYFVFPHGMLDPVLHRMYPIRHFKKWVYWMLYERKVLRDARAVMFTCEEERRLASRSFPLYSVNECVVKYGAPAPPAEFSNNARSRSARTSPAYFLFLGRIHSKKGLDILIPAYARFLKETPVGDRPDIPRLVVAGPCQSRRFLEQLKGAARALGVADKIEWPGMLSGDNKWSMLAGADAFILPSYQENFGIAVAEALAVGTPALISDRVNIWREIVEDDAALVEPANEAGTVRLFRRWTALAPQQREAMGKCARSSFQNRFEISAVAEDFAAKLSTLIRRPDSAG